MRWRRSSQDEVVNDIDLTPMIDMVFILLIFFIVSTSFIKESGVVVERPAASTGEAQQVQVVVGIDSDNVLWLEGDTVDIRTLSAHMDRLLAEKENLAVIVAADVQSNSGVLVKVIDMCRMAGVRDVSVATKEAS
ncbi:ExbD/TolR family protein [Oleidesulfovibrio sp.]|uniref:ExbD/TolR family protein n=1 Tax=Oleidesulfovibrio sp. TaxID=2909707 RepID=UPI003A86449D